MSIDVLIFLGAIAALLVYLIATHHINLSTLRQQLASEFSALRAQGQQIHAATQAPVSVAIIPAVQPPAAAAPDPAATVAAAVGAPKPAQPASTAATPPADPSPPPAPAIDPFEQPFPAAADTTRRFTSLVDGRNVYAKFRAGEPVSFDVSDDIAATGFSIGWYEVAYTQPAQATVSFNDGAGMVIGGFDGGLVTAPPGTKKVTFVFSGNSRFSFSVKR